LSIGVILNSVKVGYLNVELSQKGFNLIKISYKKVGFRLANLVSGVRCQM